MTAIMLVTISASVLVMGMVSAAAGDLPQEVDAALREAKEIHVATRRSNGEWSKAAPIWFAYDGDAVYFTTSPGSWKARRIRAGSPVKIRVGSATGPSFEGRGEELKDSVEVERMGEAYAAKYWIAWIGLFRPRASRVAAGKTVAFRVRPAN